MDIRISKLREGTVECGGTKVYHFHFENCQSEGIADVSWYVDENTGNQLLVIDIVHGEPEQLRKLLETYFEAKTFAEQFDIDMITFLFEQYALNEGFDIDAE